MRTARPSNFRETPNQAIRRQKRRFDVDRAAGNGKQYTPNRPAIRTYAQVGAMLGLSREGVRQIEDRAFKKIRKVLTGGADE